MNRSVTTTTHLLLACSMVVVAACGHQGERKRPKLEPGNPNGESPGSNNPQSSGNLQVTGPFLTAQHFSGNHPGMETVSKSKVVEFINRLPIFMQSSNSTNLTGKDDAPASNCATIEDAIEVVDANTVNFRIAQDTSRCNVPADKNGYVLTESIRIFATVKCSQTTLNAMAGRKASTYIQNTALCPGDSEQNELFHSEYTKKQSKGTQYQFITRREATMASDGSPCKTGRRDGNDYIANCGVYLSDSAGTEASSSVTQLIKIEAHDLQGMAGKKYFDAGYFDFTYNDWKGQVKYGTLGTQGGDYPPTFELRNANSRENVSGTYRYAPNGTTKETDPEDPEEEEEEE